MFCLNCNAALPGNAGVCGRCGMPVNNASPSHPFSQINQAPFSYQQAPFPYQNAPMGGSGGPAQPYGPAQFLPSQQGPAQQGPFQQDPAQQGPFQQGPGQQGPFQQGAAPHGGPVFQPNPSGGHPPAPQSDLGRFQPKIDSDPVPQQPDPGSAQSQPNFEPGGPDSQPDFDSAHSQPDFSPAQPGPDFRPGQPASGVGPGQPPPGFGAVSSQSAAPYAHSAPQFGSRPDTPFDAYLRRVSSRLQVPFAYLPEITSYLMVTERMSAALANMHQFFFLTQNDACNGELMYQFTNACVSWALHNYQGAPRGMMKGVAIYPVMCQTVSNPEVIAFTKQKPQMHYSAFTLACSVELSTGRIEWLDKTPVYGFAMWNGVKQVAEAALI